MKLAYRKETKNKLVKPALCTNEYSWDFDVGCFEQERNEKKIVSGQTSAEHSDNIRHQKRTRYTQCSHQINGRAKQLVVLLL